MVTLDEVLTALVTRAAQVRKAKRLFASDPVMDARIAATLAATPLLQPTAADLVGYMGYASRGSIWARIIEHFAATGNQWIGITELADALGVGKASLCQVLYVTHKGQIESTHDPARLSRKVWRLAQGTEKKI